MKLIIDPMTKLRASAIEKVNSRYIGYMSGPASVDGIHSRKLSQAKEALSGGWSVSESFIAEAEARGLDVLDFARLVVKKAGENSENPLDVLELERQRKLLAIEAATTPEEINEVLNGPA